ncbi:MAG TPA: glycoside hydrolase family 3 N-terminal domain-containing protein [Solirubrobacteraceae bacterium]
MLAIALLGCGGGNAHGHTPGRRRSADRYAALLARLSTTQLAGQRVIYAYAGLKPPRSLLTRIRHGEAAGVIFFADNIESLGQLHRVARTLQRAAAVSPVDLPLLLMTDQEGGLVRRLPGEPSLSEKRIGEGRDAPAKASEAGAGAAATLAGAGLNVNLAPVLDVFRRAGNFIDEFQRSYGESAPSVGELGAAFIAAQQRAGVAATAKHFPGLGAAERNQNTDEVPVTIASPRRTLRDVDELPYHQAIAAGVRLVMTSWAIYPALDATLPAGMSSTVIEGELRGRLRFSGVTITDSLGAGALETFGGFAGRGVLAAAAGADLLMCTGRSPAQDTPTEGESVLRGVTRALHDGALPRTSAVRAAQRVLTLRNSLD